MKEIADIVREFERRPADSYALATLVRSRGSSYRRCGARMLISTDGGTVGSLSGGCLEDEVVERAREVLRTGVASAMRFDTRRRFGCNGELEILVEPAQAECLRRLATCHRTRQVCHLITKIENGTRCVAGEAPDDSEGADFVQRIEPALQVLLLGSGPDQAAMIGIAGAMGWPVHCFESARELADSYDEWTAAVIKTHNYGRDFAALQTLLPMDLFYIGLLGPRARREQLLTDLRDIGVEAAPNLFAPAGLDLGGDSPESVALSIVSEIQAVFAGGTRTSLRDRKSPIHQPQPALAATFA